MAKIERKFMAHFINVTPNAEAAYERLGKDLEEYSVDMSADVKKTKNIIGQTSVNISSYDRSGSVEPFYADKDSRLFPWLQSIIDEGKALDDVRTDAVEVHLWEEASPANTYPAYKETVYVEVTSYGGDTTGYQIPFTCHYAGDRIKGKFDISTGKFTPDEA